MKTKFIGGLIFNLAETALIFVIGRFLKVSISYIAIIMGVFFVSRLIYGKPKHYNKWYRCCIWSCLVFISLYTISHFDLVAVIIMTSFTALISSGKVDVTDVYMWKTTTKYQDVLDYIKYNEYSDELMEFESKLKSGDSLTYLIYKYRFKEQKTFAEISELLDIETNRITEVLDKLAFAIRIYCKI